MIRRLTLIFLLNMLWLAQQPAALAQPLTWSDVSAEFDLPPALRLFAGERALPPLRAWYLAVDLRDTNYVLVPFLSDVAGGREGLVPFATRVGAAAAINGGYFDTRTGTSYSTVVTLDELRSQNLQALSRDGISYPVTRSVFSFYATRQPAIDWVYHFGPTTAEMRAYDAPMANAPGLPAAAPAPENGRRFGTLLGAIGGGPTLVKDGAIRITYNEEVFWDSGVGLAVENPRTAAGYTADSTAILLVVDGRQSASQGVDLNGLAQLMLDLACTEAMNLDGGGSTQMVVQNRLINRPEGGTFMRPIPTMLAVVHRDSLARLPAPAFEKIVDSGDDGVEVIGDGWFASANAGYWGTTPALLHPRGDGASLVRFAAGVPAGDYEVYAWWVAAFNRCTDTPMVVQHAEGRDTVRVDQTGNGSRWQRLGRFAFAGDPSEAVLVSNAATAGEFVVADAIRFVQDDVATKIEGGQTEPAAFGLARNYPNPFNPATKIEFALQQPGYVMVDVFDVRGRLVRELVRARQDAGLQRVTWDGRDGRGAPVSSGVYIYTIRIEAGGTSSSLHGKMLLVR